MEHENKTEVYGEEDGMDGMEDNVAVDIVEDAREKEQREFDAAFPDGRQSVEHQLDLYVGDMFAALRRRKEKKAGIKYGLRKRHVKKKEKKESLQQSIGTSETVEAHEGSSSDSSSSSSSEDEANEADSSKGKGESNVTMAEVMENLQYVLEFRIKNGHLGNLDEGLMDRLRDGLLMVMCTTSGSFPRRKLTKEARSAFYIFGGFIEEVAEFRQAVSEKRDMLLRESLCLGKRYDEGEEKMAITTMIRLVLGCLGPGYDWEDLVDSDYHSEMRKDIEECNKILDSDNHSLHIVKERKALYPPAALYTDKNMAKLKAMFKVDFQTGLVNDDDIKKREEHYGKNVLPVPKKKSVFRIIWDQLTDFMVILLFVAVVATAIAKEFDSSIVLACVIVLNTVIGAVEEIKAGRALAALENFNIPIARVLRKGKLEEIAAECVIPGDIVELQEGDSVPADLRLIECAQLEIVETILTGESEPVMKSPLEIKISKRRLALGDCVGNAFMGTLVAKGRGRGITVRTGARTEIGKISEAISGSGEERKTPLQQKLKWLGVWLVVIAIALCAIVVIAGVSWGHSFVPMFLSGLALAVSVIPEGLVAVTTVTMALAVRRMAKKNAIIRRLAAVEVLGSVTCICSDKTGTLTEGKMGVTEMIGSDETRYRCLKGTNIDPTCGGLVFEENCSNDDSCSNFETKFNEPAHNLLLASWLCNNAHIKFDESENVWKGIGDPTEVAILLLAYKSKLIPHEAGEKDGFEKKSGYSYTRILENSFDSERKRMSVIVKNNNMESEVFVFAKGAPEALLGACTHRMDKNGESLLITTKESREIAEQCTLMARRGLRVLGVAMKKVDTSSNEYKELIEKSDSAASVSDGNKGDKNKEAQEKRDLINRKLNWAESELTFCGMVGITDPPKKGVKEAIELCQSAGIKVVMITGDHIETASAIAGQLGILKAGVPSMERALAGPELDLLSDEAILELKPFPSVFARVSPDHKLKIVKALQKMGHITAMTGDGVNDAPAVRQADIGIAMGINGTEITKQAADMVLQNDNFATIVCAVEEGRRVFDNILKFIIYLLSCNTAEIVLFLLASAINAELPLTTIMVLWANIIADIPPAMSVGLEPQEQNILRRPPREPSAGILNMPTLILLLGQAFYIGVVSLAYYLVSICTSIGLKVVVNPPFDQATFDTFSPLILSNNTSDNRENEKELLRIGQSMAFATIITLQLSLCFLSRSVTRSVFKTGILSNKIMLVAVAGSFGSLVLCMYVKPIADWLTVVPLNGYAWLLILAAIFVQVIFTEILKLTLNRVFYYRRRTDIFPKKGLIEYSIPPSTLAPHDAQQEKKADLAFFEKAIESHGETTPAAPKRQESKPKEFEFLSLEPTKKANGPFLKSVTPTSYYDVGLNMDYLDSSDEKRSFEITGGLGLGMLLPEGSLEEPKVQQGVSPPGAINTPFIPVPEPAATTSSMLKPSKPQKRDDLSKKGGHVDKKFDVTRKINKALLDSVQNRKKSHVDSALPRTSEGDDATLAPQQNDRLAERYKFDDFIDMVDTETGAQTIPLIPYISNATGGPSTMISSTLKSELGVNTAAGFNTDAGNGNGNDNGTDKALDDSMPSYLKNTPSSVNGEMF